MVKSQFSLSWDSYKSNICGGFSSLQQNGELVDMTLAADGHFVKVHKVLIALSSPYIRELISTAPCQHPVIFLNNVSHATLCLILEYIYTGQVVVPSKNLSSFIETAKSLHIKGLENMDTESNKIEDIVDQGSNNNTSSSSGVKRKSIFSDEISLPANAKRISIKKDTPHAFDKSMNKSDAVEDDDMHDYSAALEDTDLHDSEDQFDTSQATDKSLISRSKSASTNLQFTVSIRGSLQVILNRYMYNLHSTQASGMRRWRCIDYRNRKCMAFVVTLGNVVLNRANLHCHSFHDKKILAKIEKNAVYSALHEVEGYKEKEKKADGEATLESEFAAVESEFIQNNSEGT